MKTITSKSNPHIIHACSLSKRKYREQYGLFFFEGIKLFREALDAAVNIKEVFVTEKALASYPECADIDTAYLVTDEVYAKITDESAPQGIFSVAEIPIKKAPASGSRIIIESVRDPGNVGTILRSALAFGIGEVFFSSDCADPWSPKVCRAAMGALFRQPFSCEKNTLGVIDKLRNNGYNLFAAALSDGSRPLNEIEVSEKTCFVIGNEGSGLRSETVAACDGQVIIPISEQSESLNAAVAASVLMWEMKKWTETKR